MVSVDNARDARVRNNTFVRISNATPAVDIKQSGTVVEGNSFYDYEITAIEVNAADCVIKDNDLYIRYWGDKDQNLSIRFGSSATSTEIRGNRVLPDSDTV